MRVAIAGGGAFGLSLALALRAQGAGPPAVWMRDASAAAAIRAARRSPALPGVALPGDLVPVPDPAVLAGADIVLVAVPAQALSDFLARHAAVLSGKWLVACCKGIDLATLEGPTARIAAAVPEARSAVLTGPSFAADIARGLPTALTLASAAGEDAVRLQHRLSTPQLRLYRSTDVRGAELGGALKNVIAIGCGACIGAGLGESARAALLTRGFGEMRRLAVRLGAREETLAGLSGLGDLVLTCASPQSRNFRHGAALGRGEPPEPGTIEGIATARAAARLAARHGIDLPVIRAVADLTSGAIGLPVALETLLARPLKEE